MNNIFGFKKQIKIKEDHIFVDNQTEHTVYLPAHLSQETLSWK